MPKLKPVDVLAERARSEVKVTWSDGHVSVYPMPYLRGHCPCAVCQGHGGGHEFREVGGKGAELTGMAQVGNYAIQMIYGDGHDSGIYTYDHLLAICPCEAHGGPGFHPEKV